MRDTVRTSYHGWNIIATCLKHEDSDPCAARRFTARAFAILPAGADHDKWCDASTQTTAIVDHVFTSTALCSEALVEQIKHVIDNLRKPDCLPLH